MNAKTIRAPFGKPGVTTGCRYCPNDGQCELQDVVEKVGVTEINFPIHYRNLRVEKEDPFYDRDYNLCVLCGRCVRMCQEVRGVNLLAFKQRGRATLVGPAFDRYSPGGRMRILRSLCLRLSLWRFIGKNQGNGMENPTVNSRRPAVFAE